MSTERVGRVACSEPQVFIETELVSEGPALSHGVRLYAFPLRNGLGHLQQLFRARARSKHDPVRVAEDEILPPHQEVSEPRREQRLRLGSVQAPGPRGTSAVAEHREANPLQFSSIAMQAPDHESRHATCFGLEGGKVADACLIRSARVVDHQNMPWPGRAMRTVISRRRHASATRAVERSRNSDDTDSLSAIRFTLQLLACGWSPDVLCLAQKNRHARCLAATDPDGLPACAQPRPAWMQDRKWGILQECRTGMACGSSSPSSAPVRWQRRLAS